MGELSVYHRGCKSLKDIMPLCYYCIKCLKYVSITQGLFDHPHLGECSCLICRKCGGMVHIKEQGELV